MFGTLSPRRHAVQFFPTGEIKKAGETGITMLIRQFPIVKTPFFLHASIK
jgi:hypothetical protein